MRSSLWEPFRIGGGFGGGVWLSSYQPHAFTAEHQEVLRPIAALLGSAVEHWRIWDAERRRRERLEQLEALLGTLAESLDVREVFARISEGVQPILPHDLLVLTELDLRAPDAPHRRAAPASPTSRRRPSRSPLTEQELARAARSDFEIVRDIPTELHADTERERSDRLGACARGCASRSGTAGEVRGGLGFFHREPSRYGSEDVEVAAPARRPRRA